MSLFSRLFGKPVNYSALMEEEDAVIVDVRTQAEFMKGHIKGSINMPIGDLRKRMLELNHDKPIITCCRSGGRSSMAKGLLAAAGYKVYNGGGWQSLQSRIRG
jgi:phage shock protein E